MDESSSNVEDIDTQQPWECMVLADEFESRDDFVRCQRMREDTKLHVERYFVLKQIKSADPKLSNTDFVDFIVQQICHHKSVTLHHTPRLINQMRMYIFKMNCQFRTEKSHGGSKNLARYSDNVGKKPSWACKVLATEFVYREEFERCRREATEYEVQVKADKYAEMAIKEEMKEGSVPLRFCPFAEKEKITLDVGIDFVFEEVRNTNGLRTPFCELVEDVVNALCQHNSVSLKQTPRLLHQVKKYVSGLVGKMKKGKGKMDESSSNVEDIDTQQPWECMVLADEFESRDDFVRCQRMREDTKLHVEPYFVLNQIKSADPKLSTTDFVDFIVQQICHHKSVTLHHTPRLINQMRMYIFKMNCQFRTEKSHGGSKNLARYSDNVGKKQSWTCKVLATEFVYREEFERCRREATEYEAQVKAENEEKRRLAMEDEERKQAKVNEEILPLHTYPHGDTLVKSEDEDVEGKGTDDSSSEDTSSDDSSDTDSVETRRKRKRKKKKRKWIKCRYCNWKFEKQIQLDLHNQWHMNHVCCICGLTFAAKSMLKEHRKNAHRVKRSCGCRRFKNKRRKVFKKLKHKHVCPLCGKAFEMLSQLRKHKSCALSIKLKSIKCCICYHGYKSSVDLRHHKAVFHHKLSTFQCKHCNMHFSEFQRYRSHVKSEQKKYRKFWIRGIGNRNSSPQEGVCMLNQSTPLPNFVAPDYHLLSDMQHRTLGMDDMRYPIHQHSLETGNNELVQSMNGIASNTLLNVIRMTSRDSPQPSWINVNSTPSFIGGFNYVPIQVPTQVLPHVDYTGIGSTNIQPHRLVTTGHVSMNSTNVQPQGLPTFSLASVNSPNVQPQGLPTLNLATAQMYSHKDYQLKFEQPK
ncbi:uncharacterized protein [Amphiura filiformis]|uniref:uncharacterized protein n=1 Tax=Amphiura filiformis TaxID=82378 RepID=UPI003B2110B2